MYNIDYIGINSTKWNLIDKVNCAEISSLVTSRATFTSILLLAAAETKCSQYTSAAIAMSRLLSVRNR